MTRWASVADHRRSCHRRSPWWALGQTPPRLPRRLSCSSPMASTSHTAVPCMIPALRASTDGTRGRPHRGWGVCARTLRQRPAGRRLRKPGIAMPVRPASNGAYLVRHDVLLHPIRRQEPHPLSHHQGILCQGFLQWDMCATGHRGQHRVVPYHPCANDGYDGAMTSNSAQMTDMTDMTDDGMLS